jgi:hypothetical protein
MAENAIGQEYVLQERLLGVAIQDVFYDFSMVEILQITILVAELLIKVGSGTLYTAWTTDRGTKPTSNLPPRLAKLILPSPDSGTALSKMLVLWRSSVLLASSRKRSSMIDRKLPQSLP